MAALKTKLDNVEAQNAVLEHQVSESQQSLQAADAERQELLSQHAVTVSRLEQQLAALDADKATLPAASTKGSAEEGGAESAVIQRLKAHIATLQVKDHSWPEDRYTMSVARWGLSCILTQRLVLFVNTDD